MILIEGVVFFLLLYILGGLSFYIYAVLKSWEITKFWDLSIKDGYIAGICEYPKWLLYWLELVVKGVQNNVRKG